MIRIILMVGQSLKLRELGRYLGLNPFITKLFFGSDNESRFRKLFYYRIESDDVFWDVGAHEGLVSRYVAETYAPSVIAFEPNEKVREKLEKNLAGCNATVFSFALSDVNGEAEFICQQGTLDVTSSLRGVGSQNLDSQTIEVQVKTGDSLVEEYPHCTPSVIKIDTEGYEIEVLRGLDATLGSHGVHTIGVEVHFSILRERGYDDPINEIESLLSRAGFSIKWSDWSHLIACRERLR